MPEHRLLDLIKSSAVELEKRGVESARTNVELMLCAALGCRRIDLHADSGRLVTSDVTAEFETMLSRRLAGEPLQYIIGETEFYGLRIKCDRRALIPRPETEFVVAKAIGLLESFDRLYILDLGCGTGCIGIALAMNLPQAGITATDLSESAVQLAAENAVLHGLSARIDFCSGNMFGAVANRGIRYDCIVCNPPYVTESEWSMLPRDIRAYEPKRALVSGEDGLDFIRLMVKEAPDHIVPGGCLIFEIGLGQAERVQRLVARTRALEFVETVQDYSAIERVVVARRAGR